MMSIRLRLTLLYSAILALTLGLFSVTLYAIQARYTLNALENDLILNARRTLGWAYVSLGSERWRRPPRAAPSDTVQGDLLQLPPLGLQEQDLQELRVRDTVRLLDAAGAPVDLPVNEQGEDMPLHEEGLAQLQAGQPWVEIVPGEEGRLLVYSEPIELDGELVGIVQIARSLADRDRSLRALGLALILGSLLTTLVAFGVGWVLAGVTLRPIHRITQTAQEIGQARDFSSRVAYKGPHDELGRLATTFNDMVSRLESAYQRVAHALQVQRDFVTDVSHELRTPLTTIRGNLALLQREPHLPQAEQADILHDLTGESERLIRLVSNLLTLTRADAGRKLQPQEVAAWPLVDDVCRQASLLQPGREIACEGAEDVIALADPDALKQVLLILLDNAVQHAHGPIHVALDERPREVAIRVQDSGPGISPELCERVFDRFYRGDGSRSTPGFGLGLSIAKALVEAQGGTIEVESEIEKGSTFTVRLPRAAGA